MLLALGATAVLGIMMYQGHRKPVGNPEYVALGSSFAAELGLGELAPGAPLACQRSVNGYALLLLLRCAKYALPLFTGLALAFYLRDHGFG